MPSLLCPGTSAYQAAWIMDSDAEDEDGSEEAGGSEGGADDMMAEGNAGAYSDGEGDEAPDLVDNDDAGEGCTHAAAVWEGAVRMQLHVWERAAHTQLQVWEGAARMQLHAWEGIERIQLHAREGAARMQLHVWKGTACMQLHFWDGTAHMQLHAWEGAAHMQLHFWEGAAWARRAGNLYFVLLFLFGIRAYVKDWQGCRWVLVGFGTHFIPFFSSQLFVLLLGSEDASQNQECKCVY
eukprot:1159547-Pelagomonas_calceolata.AAC.24